MKVVLTITGSQRFGTDEPEKTSLVTEGTLEARATFCCCPTRRAS